jgi:hypothetical protein
MAGGFLTESDQHLRLLHRVVYEVLAETIVEGQSAV